jgi:hypothetical protein
VDEQNEGLTGITNKMKAAGDPAVKTSLLPQNPNAEPKVKKINTIDNKLSALARIFLNIKKLFNIAFEFENKLYDQLYKNLMMIVGGRTVEIESPCEKCIEEKKDPLEELFKKFNKLKEALIGFVAMMAGPIVSIVKKFIDDFRAKINPLIMPTVNVVNAIISFYSNLYSGIVSGVTSIVSWGLNAIGAKKEAAALNKAGMALSSGIKSTGQNIQASLTSAGEAAVSVEPGQQTRNAERGGINTGSSSEGGDKQASASEIAAAKDAKPMNGNLPTARQFIGKNDVKDVNFLDNLIHEHSGIRGFTTVKNQNSGGMAWCSAFVNSVLGLQGIKGTGNPAARSWLNYGTKIWEKGEPVSQIKELAKEGDIVVFDRGGPPHGHVALFVSFDGKSSIQVLGGNQGDKASGADAVNEHHRNIFKSKDDLLTIRRASGGKPEAKPTQTAAAAPPKTPAPKKAVAKKPSDTGRNSNSIDNHFGVNEPSYGQAHHGV